MGGAKNYAWDEKRHGETWRGRHRWSGHFERDSRKTGLETAGDAEKYRPRHSRKEKSKETQGVPGGVRHWKGLSDQQRCARRGEAETERDVKSKAETGTMRGGGGDMGAEPGESWKGKGGLG